MIFILLVHYIIYYLILLNAFYIWELNNFIIATLLVCLFFALLFLAKSHSQITCARSHQLNTCSKEKRNAAEEVSPPPPPLHLSTPPGVLSFWADLVLLSTPRTQSSVLQQPLFLRLRTWRHYYCGCGSTRAQSRFMTTFDLCYVSSPMLSTSPLFHSFFRGLARTKKHFVKQKDLLRMSPA